MAAKTKTTKKTVKKKTTFRRKVKPVESSAPELIVANPNSTFKPAQPIQAVPVTGSAQPMSVRATSPIARSMTNNPTMQPASSDGEPEIKIGTGTNNKSLSAVGSDRKGMNPKADASQIAAEALKEKSGSKKNLLLPIIFIVLLGIAILGGLFIYRENFTNKIEEKINEVSLSPSPIEKPTPKPLDLSKFEIEILNGSGIAGEASSQKSDLESMGFKVVSIGNADNSDYVETVIQAKKSVDKTFLDKLKTTLEESFKVTAEELDDEVEIDIVVIIGSEKAE